MTLFGEFHFQLDAVPFERTLTTLPEIVIQIERVVVSEEFSSR